MTAQPTSRTGPGGVLEVLWVFLRLGLTSFGGPVAHLGYLRETFVVRRRWLSEPAYADLVALCQFLPGPASSQVGMAIGLQRAGGLGLLAAWIGFTLPSAVLLVAFAYGVSALDDVLGTGWLIGLKAAAVAVVAHAVLGMAKSLAPDARRATITVGVLAVVLLVPGAFTQVAAIIAAGVVGFMWLRPVAVEGSDEFRTRVPPWVAVACLAGFVLLLVGLPLVAAVTRNGTVELADIFYRAGALVFGGGHVLLPLLQAELVPAGLVDAGTFLAGYGAAQAIPGPLFTFSAYLGAVSSVGPAGVGGAAIALVATFVPGALLVVAALPCWEALRDSSYMQRVLAGVNAGWSAFWGPRCTRRCSPMASRGRALWWWRRWRLWR